MRLLLVEDQPDAARMIAKGLREQAYAVDVVEHGDAACHEASVHDYDAILLDVMLPRRDGFSVCREIRQSGSAVPILMLTAMDDVEARVTGLDAGADDYLTKPFDFRELLARIRALVRRGSQPPAPDRFRVGDLEFDVHARRVVVHGAPMQLTTREYALLEHLGRRSDAVVGRSDIAEHVWDDRYDPFSNVIDVYVQRLRRKLTQAGASSEIRTRRGEGYQLVPGGMDRPKS
jgi:two-component system, OmpR family, copper resistance phosphate regulon response regulator CusR